MDFIKAININKPNIEEEFNEKMKIYNTRNYNTFLISYFEGKTLHHSKNRSFYKYIDKPKYLAFELLCNHLKNQKFYDIEIVYTINNNQIHSKDKYFLWKLMHPLCKIYINVKVCKFPPNNEHEYLNNLYKEKNENIKQILNKLV